MKGPTPTPDAIGRVVAAQPLKDLARLLAMHRAATASGLWGSSVAAVVAAIEKELRRPVVLICGHLDEADDLADDVEMFCGRRPDVVAALELSGALGHLSEEQVASRLPLICRYAAGVPDSALLVAPIQALMQSVPSRQQLDLLVRMLTPGQSLEPEKLIVWLSEHGYNRLEQVEVPGDFAVRGGIVDLYLPGDFDESSDQVGLTARIDFFGDQVDDAAVRTPQGRRELRPERRELPAAGREVARISAPERAGVARRAVAEHEVLPDHWTMKWSSVRFVVHRRNISMSRSSADSSLCMR